MAQALSVDRVVRVSVNLAPQAAKRRNFGALLLMGSSKVIDQGERIRAYTGPDGVLQEFGVDAPESQAAMVFFGQTPRPSILYIGRWVRQDASSVLRGASLAPDEAALAEWTGIENGSLTISIGGADQTVDELDFSEATTLEGIAAIVSAELEELGAKLDYDGSRFILSTIAAGAAAQLGYAEGALATQMKLTVETGLAPVGGMAAESPTEAVLKLADVSAAWYGLAFADADLTIDQHLAVMAYVESSPKSRIYTTTITDRRVRDAVYEADLATRGKALSYRRSMAAHSANQNAALSAVGRAFTVNFNANRSTITLKFKQLPGIAAEQLTETEAQTLEKKRCNVFAQYNNDTAIFQEGVMLGPAYFDEIHGLDWLSDAVQVAGWNLLYQSKTKIPQTDSGINQIIAVIEGVLAEAVNNGLIAPGVWNADGFGTLQRGDYLKSGWYIYVPSVDDQDQSEREQRKAPPIQIAIKLAGAVHSIDVIIDVNR